MRHIVVKQQQNFPAFNPHKETLLDGFDYAMHGKVFKYGDAPGSGGGGARLEVYFSFGGLLMRLAGDPSKLRTMAVDSVVYLLMRKL